MPRSLDPLPSPEPTCDSFDVGGCPDDSPGLVENAAGVDVIGIIDYLGHIRKNFASWVLKKWENRPRVL